MNAATNLLFVYNADSGLFNTLADIGHKIFSPKTYKCDLCQITHGYFTEHAEWGEFIAQLDLECRFLHRDEFHEEYSDRSTILPAVFIQKGERMRVCIDADRLHQCGSLEELISCIKESCLST